MQVRVSRWFDHRPRLSVTNVYHSGSQSVLFGFQGIREQFPRDQWIRFCNGYFEVS
jgi:hypothetical protein